MKSTMLSRQYMSICPTPLPVDPCLLSRQISTILHVELMNHDGAQLCGSCYYLTIMWLKKDILCG